MTEPTAGYASPDERNWALLTHFLAAVGVFFGGMLGWVMPLVTYVAKAPQSPTLRAHAVEALNFNITWAIIDLVAVLLGNCFGMLHLPVLRWLLGLIVVVPIVFNIIAGVRAADGVVYRHPLSFPLLK